MHYFFVLNSTLSIKLPALTQSEIENNELTEESSVLKLKMVTN